MRRTIFTILLRTSRAVLAFQRLPSDTRTVSHAPTTTSAVEVSPHRFTSIFIWAMVAGGMCAIGLSLLAIAREPLPREWLLLALVTVLSGAAMLSIRSANVSISVSDAFVFAALTIFGPAAATITVALDALAISLRLVLTGRLKLPLLLFNVATPSLAIAVAGTLFIAPLRVVSAGTSLDFLEILLPLVAAVACYFLLGTGPIAILMALQQRESPYAIWRRSMLRLWPGYASGAYVAGLLSTYARNMDLRLGLYLLPIPAILYYAFRASIGRVEDQVRHLAESNETYQRVIEALAHAVDAKDQVTHGHIRRVQEACARLAKALGVSDAGELRALQAAALLHDVGKLAVPEHVLNKPGKLTPIEYEQMKQHSAKGADVLSAVQFPYPVVPIVRHHHENWDGSGYPDGLREHQIPLGARILSVVDCFDALTSDRPYRSALGEDEALAIISERRGTMYDPTVVDAFTRLQKSNSSVITRRTAAPDVREPVAVTSVDRGVPASTIESVCAELHRTLAAELCLFFEYDRAADVLVAIAGAGVPAVENLGCRMRRGERVTGWVGANQQPAVNAAAELDLGDAAARAGLQCCLSLPMSSSQGLIGVLTVYSTRQHAFNEIHVDICKAAFAPIVG